MFSPLGTVKRSAFVQVRPMRRFSEDHQMKDEALKLARKASAELRRLQAELDAIKQALAAQQEHEPENEPFVSLASVQEPVGYWLIGTDHVEFDKHEYHNGPEWEAIYTTPPAAQPAVPDAMTSADIQEHIEYVAGWNDCRQAMLEMMK
jgi:hypothetical protein